jgi:hypothetical protein
MIKKIRLELKEVSKMIGENMVVKNKMLLGADFKAE